MSRIVVAAQGSIRAVTGLKDSVKDTAAATSGSKRVRRLCGARECSKAKSGDTAGEDKRKRAEESLRTLMYLSCWGPN